MKIECLTRLIPLWLAVFILSAFVELISPWLRSIAIFVATISLLSIILYCQTKQSYLLAIVATIGCGVLLILGVVVAHC